MTRATRIVMLMAAVAWAVPAAAQPAGTALVLAAMQRDAAAATALLAAGADVNAADGDGTTALHWAAYHGEVDLARALLAAGARVNAASRIGGMTALHMAARNGHAAIVGLLLDAGADAREANGNGTTVLMAAAGSGSAEAVTRLLDAGADVNAVDATNGQSALMFAAARNADAAIRVLLARGANPAATTKVVRLGRVLVDANGDPLSEEEAARIRSRQASTDPRRQGRVFGATVMGGMTALHFAAREGHMAAVRALVEGGASVNEVSGGEQTSPIVEAIINGHLDMARDLLDRGADPTLANIDGLTPLYAAVDMKWRHNTWYPQPTVDEERTGYLDLMSALIDKGADVNARLMRKLWFRKFRYGDDWVEPMGATAFWRAAQANDVAAMRLLASRGADPEIPTLLGVTPLMVAAGVGFEYQGTNIAPDARLAAVKYLVEDLRLDVNARDIQHYTPLHGAAYVGENDLVQYLVDHGADPKARARGRLGGTQGAVDVPEGTGDTVADMANGPREKSLLHPDTVRLLESLGSLNSHDCRSTACVNNTKRDTPEKPPGQ
ncbi:MAG: ankyrin repeat domain-containing protein [Vicinamibacterales bacterium]